MTRIHLATALVRRGGEILLTASRYPNHPQPLWNLPGGRQQPGELLEATVLRELREEAALQGRVRELAYVSESYDGATHFCNFTFLVEAAGEPHPPQEPGDHIADVRWVPISEIEHRLMAGVVREPLLRFLSGSLTLRYAGYAEAGITIEFPD